MTEAMSRREIEDVLSSIRRIVSHDVHPAAAQGALHDKLLLTSSLRVDHPAPISTIEEDATVAAGHLPTPQAAPLNESGPDTSPRPVQIVDEAAPEAMHSSLLSRISTASKTTAVGLAAAHQHAPEPASAAPIADRAEDAVQSSIEDSALEATLARLEAVLANSVQPHTADSHEVDTVESDEEIIDEGVLYQIVAHIVRQELQGELGEKITRNIRKLVRAEVARELQLRKF